MTTRLPVQRWRRSDGTWEATRRPDTLAVEEPLEIRAGGQVVTVTMRTPGEDLDLVHGYLLAEGIIEDAADIAGARYCAGAVATGPDGIDQNTYNVLEVDLRDPARVPLGLSRAALSTSACGVCGSASIEAVRARLPRETTSTSATMAPGAVLGLVDDLRSRQEVFAKTGGLHAAGLGDVSGALAHAAEDVGRHNAVDKVIGAGLRSGYLPRTDAVLTVSSRGSFEIVQKAAVAGIPIVIVVSAPSSLAVETAAAFGLTLIAFARGDRFNVYSGAERLEG